jgi:hypothetical protein
MEFYRTSNSDYGRPWVTFNGESSIKQSSTVSSYRDVASSTASHRTKLALLKTKVMLEKEIEDLETNQPPRHTFDPCIPEPSPNRYTYNPENMHYPEPGLKSPPVYVTSNSDYGRVRPSVEDLPNKYCPRNTKFTSAFIESREPDTGLNTFMTPSRVHKLFDS